VKDLVVAVEYLDVRLKKDETLTHTCKKGYTSFCYLIEGLGEFGSSLLDRASLALFTESGKIKVTATEDVHYIFVSGQRLDEPIAWGGPIVMNTREELELAFQELDAGTFIKS